MLKPKVYRTGLGFWHVKVAKSPMQFVIRTCKDWHEAMEFANLAAGRSLDATLWIMHERVM